ncbi:MAG: zf-HC2 domain-containing protein [Pyrinomonadaceae bacterium]|nr:zf-HC2 domain-containing protein [Pyrinomonadaceae bacterium]
MKCEDLQLNIPLYAEGELTAEENVILEAHLAQCPVCRVRLSEFHSISNDLRNLSAPQMPADLLYAVRSSLAVELNAPKHKSWFNFSEEFKNWLQLQIMPYGIATVVSLALLFAFFLSLNSTREHTDKVIETARINTNRALPTEKISSGDQISYSKEEFAALRVPVSSESPSLNPSPNSPLLSLTKSLVRGKMRDDEVTLVADVFDNGLSQIAQVVEAPRNRQTMDELSKALENDPAFVPAELDNRSDTMRVVFKIQIVEVKEKTPAKKKSPVK